MDCGFYVGQVLGLKGTVKYTEDWYWVCSGLHSIRKPGTGSVLDCRTYVGLVLGI